MLVFFSFGMGCGQVLLKYSAQRQVTTADSSLLIRLFALFSDWTFLLGIVSYGLLLIYWIWLLTFIPLSRAYPFTLISLVVAAIGAALFFDEPLTLPFIVGMVFIGIGLVILSTG